ncbi:MAG: hypothetical protein ACYCS2_08520 [Acidimicrobiales bacterium]
MVFACLVASVVIGGLYDVFDPNRVALLPLVMAPLLGAVLLPPRSTAAISGLCVALALVLPQGFVTTSGIQYVRLSALTALALVAALASVWRQRLVGTQIRLEVAAARAEEARRRALELNDNVHQSLFAARAWSELGDKEAADAALDRALQGTTSLLAEMLEDFDPEAGALRQRSQE